MANSAPTSTDAIHSPVLDLTDRDTTPEEPKGTALCLSGGGYRAMLFHVGTLWRLNEAGLLTKIDRISSVSGGSLTAGILGLKWPHLEFNGQGVATRFATEVMQPIQQMAGTTIDEGSIFGGLANPFASITDNVIKAYRDNLFGDATLQDLPDSPQFVINATNVQSGALCRFSKPYMRDYRVGKVENPTIPLALAVAASSAFPPVLSPVRLTMNAADFTPGTGDDLQHEPFTTHLVLTDGGVYDNLGLETAWKRCKTILVSDAGGKIEPEPEPKADWARHSIRVSEIVDDQVRSLRKRLLIDSYRSKQRNGAYWGIRGNIQDYGLTDALDSPHEQTMKLAQIKTRLQKLDVETQERLINWGYAICDVALRAHTDLVSALPAGFPFRARGI